MFEYTKTVTTTQPAPQRNRVGDGWGGLDLDRVIAYTDRLSCLTVWLDTGAVIEFGGTPARKLLLKELVELFG